MKCLFASQKVNRRLYDCILQNSAGFCQKRKRRGSVDRGEGDLSLGDGDEDDGDGSGFVIIERFALSLRAPRYGSMLRVTPVWTERRYAFSVRLPV